MTCVSAVLAAFLQLVLCVSAVLAAVFQLMACVSAVLAAFLQLVLCVLVVNEARITRKKHGRLVRPQATEVDL